MMQPTQRPTCTGIRVRTTRDANVLFHAVAIGVLPIVARRLDAADRAALRPGCVYIWEERTPSSDATGVGMERFTEGRHWHPSRVRDDFLIYTEKREDPADLHSPTERGPRRQWSGASLDGSSPTVPYSYDRHDARYPPSAPQPAPLIKQTYSAWVNIPAGVRKWHMNAYYSEDALEHLRTVDDIPELANLNVPHECYKRARSSTNRARDAAPPSPPRSLSQVQAQQVLQQQQSRQPPYPYPASSAQAQPGPVYSQYLPGYAPPPPTYSYGPAPAVGPNLYQQAYALSTHPENYANVNGQLSLVSPTSPAPSSSGSDRSIRTAGLPLYPIEDDPIGRRCGFNLVPLENLENYNVPRRERMDDEVLRSFRVV